MKEGALGAPEKAWAVGQDLQAMERLRKGKDTPFGLVEDRARQALSKHPDPEAQGRVYYQVAHTYAQGGINVKERAEKVVEYSQKALACPLDPVRRLRLYDYWGDALWFVQPDQPFPDWRRAAALVYLQGLKEAQKYHVPDKPPDPPLAATKVLRQESDEARRAPDAWKRRLEEIAAIRARALYETDLYHARKVLVGQIVDVYRRPPHAATELRQLADGILEDPAEVEAVMKAVEKEGGLSDDPPDAPKRPGRRAS